jgi:hypothetical protein
VKILFILKRVLFWSYDRGTWQYDVMCVLILSFIFLVPASVFDDPEARSRKAGLGPVMVVEVPADTGGAALGERIEAAAHGRVIERIEVVRDTSGRVARYKIWSRGPAHPDE